MAFFERGYTVASFLREKVGNMEVWLRGNGAEARHLPQVSDLALVTFAQELHNKFANVLEKRDFDLLLSDKENLPPELMAIVDFVQSKPALHDKFWRYLQLFSDTVSNDE